MMDAFGVFVSGMVALFLGVICLAVYQSHEHAVFLREHGCQLVTKAETGRQILVGKLERTEYVYVYECVDGDRTEIGE
jgi:hypothetical protein